MRCLIRSNN